MPRDPKEAVAAALAEQAPDDDDLRDWLTDRAEFITDALAADDFRVVDSRVVEEMVTYSDPDADSDRWQRMYLRAIERHHENLDAILNAVALAGDLKSVVRCVVDWLDGMDALADSDHDLLRRAWVAAGGTLADFPVSGRLERVP